MKATAAIVASLIVGMVVGSALTYKVAVSPLQKAMADGFVSDTMYQTRTALQLRKAKQIELAQEIDMHFPNNVLTLHHIYSNHPMSSKALQYIKSYYQTNALPVPTKIQQILSKLPESSQKKKQGT